MKVLVLGAAGLLGNAVYKGLSEHPDWTVYGTIREDSIRPRFAEGLARNLLTIADLTAPERLRSTLRDVRPQVVVNCLSIPKAELRDDNLQAVIAGLSVLPQHIARECAGVGARLIHFSSDAVFAGTRPGGNYSEEDAPDAVDAYGIAKLLGEVRDPHAVSLRTSMIGHELRSAHGLLEWFLSQHGSCRCYRRAMWSGLTTTELARLLRDVVIPNSALTGVYHVAGRPISKLDLLRTVAEVYGREIEIVADDRVVIDRTLDASRFAGITGYAAPPWRQLIAAMHAAHVRSAALTA